MKSPAAARQRYTSANREAWNLSAKYHRESDNWTKLKESFSSPEYSFLDKTITASLSGINVADSSVVQIGCNNGIEVLSTCALGARDCLGIDQSDEFIAQANELQAISGHSCDFLCADIYALGEDVRRDFDIALITIGVLDWMPDIDDFMAAVASLLKPGGHVLIYETHPTLEMFDPFAEKPFEPAWSYFLTEPSEGTEAIVYDGGEHEASISYWFPHSMSDVITSCISSGLEIRQFTEYAHSNREVDYDKYENVKAQLPMCYTLTAQTRAD